jgi:tRNA threonylcarbamoyladenosine biosynthesis protein TsaB
MPKILALDTSTDACSVALNIEGEVREDFRVIPRQHTQQLLPMIETMMADAGLKISQLDAIAFGRGPGSFAGIRIATGVTQGLAYAADIPVLPISTLEALALGAHKKTQAIHVVAALDARMNEIYVAAYDFDAAGNLTVVLDEQVCAPADLALDEQSRLAIGSGWRYVDDMSDAVQNSISVADELYYPSAGDMLKLAENALLEGKAVNAAEALPVYLRDEVAWKKKDQQ